MGGYNFQGIHSFLLEVDIYFSCITIGWIPGKSIPMIYSDHIVRTQTQIYILPKRLTIYGKNSKYFSAHKICNQKNQNKGFV